MKASFNYQRLKYVAIVIALLHFAVWPQYIQGTLSLIAVSCVLFILHQLSVRVQRTPRT